MPVRRTGFEPAPAELPAFPRRSDFLAATAVGAAMKTVFLLLYQYDGAVAVPLETVARDYFGVDKGGMQRFLRKLDSPSFEWNGRRRARRWSPLRIWLLSSTRGAPTRRMSLSS